MNCNKRNAGRKPKFTEEQITEILNKRKNGMTVSKLAAEYGVSRQTMSAYLNADEKEDRNEIIYRTLLKHKVCFLNQQPFQSQVLQLHPSYPFPNHVLTNEAHLLALY